MRIEDSTCALRQQPSWDYGAARHCWPQGTTVVLQADTLTVVDLQGDGVLDRLHQPCPRPAGGVAGAWNLYNRHTTFTPMTVSTLGKGSHSVSSHDVQRGLPGG